MNKIHFENQHEIIIKSLRESQKNVYIAVSWLNFELYGPIFLELALKEVNIKIVVNDDLLNARYTNYIEELESHGVKVKKIRMFNKYNYMHHKFCIIDSRKILIGSFNWSKNAIKNFENLIETDNYSIIRDTVTEFNTLWKFNKAIRELQKKNKCADCLQSKYNLMILFSDSNHTLYKIISVCECSTESFNELKSDLLDIGLYNSILNINEYYSELLNEYEGYSEQLEILNSDFNYELSQIYSELQEDYLIHGIAVVDYEVIFQDGDGEFLTRVIWKSRFADGIQEEYDSTFGFV